MDFHSFLSSRRRCTGQIPPTARIAAPRISGQQESVVKKPQRRDVRMGRRSEFTREEKIAAVKLVEEGGRSVLSVANEYGIHENTLGKLRRLYAINPESAFTGASVGDSTEIENERLKHRIRELENEVDFLKKCRRISRRARSKIRRGQETCGQSWHCEGMRLPRCPPPRLL